MGVVANCRAHVPYILQESPLASPNGYTGKERYMLEFPKYLSIHNFFNLKNTHKHCVNNNDGDVKTYKLLVYYP